MQHKQSNYVKQWSVFSRQRCGTQTHRGFRGGRLGKILESSSQQSAKLILFIAGGGRDGAVQCSDMQCNMRLDTIVSYAACWIDQSCQVLNPG